MNKDLKDFLEKQKATYSSMIEQEKNKRKFLLEDTKKCEMRLAEHNKLLTQIERDELLYGDNSK